MNDVRNARLLVFFMVALTLVLSAIGWLRPELFWTF